MAPKKEVTKKEAADKQAKEVEKSEFRKKLDERRAESISNKEKPFYNPAWPSTDEWDWRLVNPNYSIEYPSQFRKLTESRVRKGWPEARRGTLVAFASTERKTAEVVEGEVISRLWVNLDLSVDAFIKEEREKEKFKAKYPNKEWKEKNRWSRVNCVFSELHMTTIASANSVWNRAAPTKNPTSARRAQGLELDEEGVREHKFNLYNRVRELSLRKLGRWTEERQMAPTVQRKRKGSPAAEQRERRSKKAADAHVSSEEEDEDEEEEGDEDEDEDESHGSSMEGDKGAAAATAAARAAATPQAATPAAEAPRQVSAEMPVRSGLVSPRSTGVVSQISQPSQAVDYPSMTETRMALNACFQRVCMEALGRSSSAAETTENKRRVLAESLEVSYTCARNAFEAARATGDEVAKSNAWAIVQQISTEYNRLYNENLPTAGYEWSIAVMACTRM